ncbi:hypothetical protein [Streptomyces sp. NPDC007346]
MPSFKINVSSADVFVATPPASKLASEQAGETAVDRESGAQPATLSLLL